MSVSEPTTSRRMKWVAALIPVVCIALLMVRGEVRSVAATTFLVPISGYDPRDLLHGQYIRFRFEFHDENSASSCEGSDCCLCLRGGEMTSPRVRRVACQDTASACDAVVSERTARDAQRYLVPEHAGILLEHALREREASVEMQCSHDGGFALGGLYLDGRPWRELVD